MAHAFLRKQGWVWLAAGGMFFGGILLLKGEEENLAEGREPVIFAHHMGSLNVGRGAMAHIAEHPNLGDPRSSNGGHYRNLALAPREVGDLTVEESAQLQIRRAMAIGIDGFAVNAWAGKDEAREFLSALFTVAEENDYPFAIGICPDANTLPQPDGYIPAVAGALRYLLDRHGDSPKLARRDGKPIVFGYQSAFIWVDYLKSRYDDPEVIDHLRTSPEGWAMISDAFEQVEALVGKELYFQFDFGAFFYGVEKPVPDHLHAEAAAAVARQLPAVGQFLPNRHTMDIAHAVIAEGAEWGHPVYLNYDNNRTDHARGGPGTTELRQRWREARELGSTLIQYTTWNDYGENTNVSPGTKTRYAYYDLTGYFIEWWKRGAAPQIERDKVYIFSRLYPEDGYVFPFRGRHYHPGAIEILSLLTEPADIEVPGRGGPYAAPEGLHAEQFPVTPGEVSARLLREGTEILHLESPEPVTERPFRQDNGIVAISSECARYWETEWGSADGLLNAEYADDDEDGLPNWFEMFWFGTFNDYTTATVADPSDVMNEEGMTNLEAYLDQKSPIGGEYEHLTGPFHGEPAKIPGIIEAEDFDHGGQHIGYFDTTRRNQGESYRIHEWVDVEPTHDEIPGYNVAWIVKGEWLLYTVEVETSGSYTVKARVASPYEGKHFHIRFDGVNVSGPVVVPQTKAWQVWGIVEVPGIWLEEGVQEMRVQMDATDFNIDYFEFIREETFESWQSAFFRDSEKSDPMVGGLEADPDGDGVINLFEYALGGNPRKSDRSVLPRGSVVTLDNRKYLQFEYKQPVAPTDIRYRWEISKDLDTWTDADERMAAISVTRTGEFYAMTVRDREPLEEGDRRYFRLNVVLADEGNP